MKINNVLVALTSFITVTLGSTAGRACKEGSLLCGGSNPGGAVLACKDGRWKVLMDCGASEFCTNDPVPTCTWASADTGPLGPDIVFGFEMPAAEVSAAANNHKDTNASIIKGVTADDSAPYYNICSPCIRHNDYCKASCAWQGKDCDRTCNWKTCSVNLTTGDFRQPTVSCGRFCKWPCH